MQRSLSLTATRHCSITVSVPQPSSIKSVVKQTMNVPSGKSSAI